MDMQQFLFFVVDNKTYGVDVLKIESIERPGSITRVPKAPEAVIGVMNLRGDILPVLSLRQKIGLTLNELNDNMRIIVLTSQENRLGILVDKVIDVKTVDTNNIYSIEEIEGSEYRVSDLIYGAVKDQTEELVTILNTNRILSNNCN